MLIPVLSTSQKCHQGPNLVFKINPKIGLQKEKYFSGGLQMKING